MVEIKPGEADEFKDNAHSLTENLDNSLRKSQGPILDATGDSPINKLGKANSKNTGLDSNCSQPDFNKKGCKTEKQAEIYKKPAELIRWEIPNSRPVSPVTSVSMIANTSKIDDYDTSHFINFFFAFFKVINSKIEKSFNSENMY